MIAEFDESGHGLGVGRDAVRAECGADQFQGLIVFQYVTCHPVSTVKCDEPIEFSPARHQRERPVAWGKEPAHAGRVGHVVEKNQHAALGQQRSIESGLCFRAHRNVAWRTAEALQQQGQSLFQ